MLCDILQQLFLELENLHYKATLYLKEIYCKQTF